MTSLGGEGPSEPGQLKGLSEASVYLTPYVKIFPAGRSFNLPLLHPVLKYSGISSSFSYPMSYFPSKMQGLSSGESATQMAYSSEMTFS